MALAEKFHHSACRSVPLKEELVEHEQHNAPQGQKTASGREAEFFDVFDEELGVGRPPPLPEVAGPQARVLRHTVEQMIESFVPVPILDLDSPVPQMVEQLVGVLKVFDKSLPGWGPAPCCSSQAAAGGTVGGSADAPRLRSCCRGRANPWVEGSTGSAPPGQGGIQVLATATVADVAVVAVPCVLAAQVPAVHVQLDSVHLQSGGYSSCYTETGMHSVFCAEDR